LQSEFGFLVAEFGFSLALAIFGRCLGRREPVRASRAANRRPQA
jgi:hypothetical protein